MIETIVTQQEFAEYLELWDRTIDSIRGIFNKEEQSKGKTNGDAIVALSKAMGFSEEQTKVIAFLPPMVKLRMPGFATDFTNADVTLLAVVSAFALVNAKDQTRNCA